ncbi:esterase/lipase family protein [Yinghuangia sp. YIM S09857]|uniref:esterase/lipase family protein n=1 Tax=Yinghuangia sp. YIM S09857 TaxID=3436929 RepID=UPI003F52A701
MAGTFSGDGYVDLGDGVALAAPGLLIDVDVVPEQPFANEELAIPVDPVHAALAASGMAAERTLAVTTTAATPAEPPPLILDVPASAPGTAQVLRYQDAAGLWHWAWPQSGGAAAAPPPGPAPETAPDIRPDMGTGMAPEMADEQLPVGTTRFAVPAAALDTGAAPPPPEGPDLDEGLIGTIVRKVVHELVVLVYPVVDRVLDPIVDNLAQQHEIKTRPYGVRTFTPDNYAVPYAPDSRVETPEQWARFAEGRVLLLVHGTFSTSHGGFGELDTATVAALHEAYGGRVIAFDHPTVSVSIEANIDALHRMTAASGPLDVDVLAHSRGGLVARELVRRQGASDAKYRVRRVVFAATPNRGTPLADPEHVVKFIDRHTNLLTLLPGPAEIVGDTLAGLMTAVQILGHAALKDLDGLCGMCPGSPTLASLAAADGDGAEYYAVQADFEPTPGLALKLRAGDLLMDAVFPEANDLVVPTQGVCLRDHPGAPAAGFPIPEERALHFTADRAVWHSSLFGEPQTRAKLLEWLRP